MLAFMAIVSIIILPLSKISKHIMYVLFCILFSSQKALLCFPESPEHFQKIMLIFGFVSTLPKLSIATCSLLLPKISQGQIERKIIDLKHCR